MVTNEFELHPNRLSTTDATGRRVYVFPADVRGIYRSLRTKVQFVLVLFFLALPWFKINGHQALLLDIGRRHFEIFGLSLRAHNAPLLLFVFAAAAFGLLFATALFGRVWCGWACPQTVFIDGVFRRIERWIDGPASAQKELQRATWGLKKISKRIFKWSLFTLVALIISHSLLAFLIGTDRLAEIMQKSPLENWSSFLLMAFISGLILFDFGWFREQFCTIVCPYGRFQSVLMDRQSLVVAYDVNRGEPRFSAEAKQKAKNENSKLGDCVNCYRCVKVCPTGIDIRRGLQMECIACTSCIDACNEVMAKLKKPANLIRYERLDASETKFRIEWRASIYLFLCVISLSALFGSLYFMKPIDVQVLRAKDSPYTVQISDNGEEIVTNHFKLELSNQSGIHYNMDLKPVDLIANLQIISAMSSFSVSAGKVVQTDFFVRFPKAALSNGQRTLRLIVKATSKDSEISFEKEVLLVGPFS